MHGSTAPSDPSNEQQPLLHSQSSSTTTYGTGREPSPVPDGQTPLLHNVDSQPVSTSPNPVRIAYLDNLRTFLTILVVVHHAIGAYGGISWIFMPQGECHSYFSCFPSTVFGVMNESFFMATFFILSGYFSAGALERKKNVWVFIKDKIWRLLVPLLGYVLIVETLILLSEVPYYGWEKVKEMLGEYFRTLWWKGPPMGPTWFLSTLFVFDVVHALIFVLQHELITRKISSSTASPQPLALQTSSTPSVWSKRRFAITFILSYMITIPIAFLLRTVRYAWPPLRYIVLPYIGFLGQLPQYILAYTAGCYLPSFLPHIISTSSARLVWMRLMCSYMVPLTGLLVMSSEKVYGRAILYYVQSGGWRVQALVFEIWDEASFVLISTALLSLFAFYSPQNTPHPSSAISSSGETLSTKIHHGFRCILAFFTPRHSYAVYIIHPAILTALVVWLDVIPAWSSWDDCVPKGTIVAVVCAFLSWWMAKWVVKIPSVGNII
jgi:glucans biosynthesis protein C